MKKILFMILLIPMISMGQVNIGIGAGYSTKNYPAYEMKIGYEFRRLNLNGGFQRSLNRDPNTDILFGGEVGLNLLSEADAYQKTHSIIISGGYWYDKINSDQETALNSWKPSISIKYFKALKEDAGLYGEVMYIKNNFSVQAGILFKFTN